jgi:hypothetical protein
MTEKRRGEGIQNSSFKSFGRPGRPRVTDEIRVNKGYLQGNASARAAHAIDMIELILERGVDKE